MNLSATAKTLAALLAERRVRVVFAESCTAGLVSATLARVPGISEWHCGSAVVYRYQTKTDWLGVSARDLAKYSAVSEPIARQMALGVLRSTVEADYSAAVTGHLGPQAPPELDGVIFIGIAHRRAGKPRVFDVRRFQLAKSSRVHLQRETARLTLERLLDAIHDS